MSDMIALLNDLSYIPPNNEQNEPIQEDIGETSNEPTQLNENKFEELYASANEELYPGCDYVTRLDFMAKFTYFKVKGKLTDSIFNEILEFFQHVFPTTKGYKLPPSYYAIKKTFKRSGLGKGTFVKDPIWVEGKRPTTYPQGEPRNPRVTEDSPMIKDPVPRHGDAFVLPILAEGPGGAEGGDRDQNYWGQFISISIYIADPVLDLYTHHMQAPALGKILMRASTASPKVIWDAPNCIWNESQKSSPSRSTRQNRAQSNTRLFAAGIPITCFPRDEMMESSETREYPSLIDTFFVTHTVNGVFIRDEDRAIYEEMLRLRALGSNTESGVPYTDEEIKRAMAPKGKANGGTSWCCCRSTTMGRQDIPYSTPSAPASMHAQLRRCRKAEKEEQVPNQTGELDDEAFYSK
ncbi:hypothetical protein Tco_0401771 [Tanacetum coccineum]